MGALQQVYIIASGHWASSDPMQDQKSAGSVLDKEALFHHQDHRRSFKSDLRWEVVSPGEEKNLQPDSKLLISVKA